MQMPFLRSCLFNISKEKIILYRTNFFRILILIIKISQTIDKTKLFKIIKI